MSKLLVLYERRCREKSIEMYALTQVSQSKFNSYSEIFTDKYSKLAANIFNGKRLCSPENRNQIFVDIVDIVIFYLFYLFLS